MVYCFGFLLQELQVCIDGVLQIRRGNRDNLGISSYISPLNIFCDPSLEPSHRDGSNEGSQHMFSLRNKKNYVWIILNIPSYMGGGRVVRWCLVNFQYRAS